MRRRQLKSQQQRECTPGYVLLKFQATTPDFTLWRARAVFWPRAAPQAAHSILGENGCKNSDFSIPGSLF